MKKILLSLLLVAGVLTSCDMDKNPYGTLNGEDPFAGMNDASRYRNGIYSGIRAVATSAYFTNPEIQMDMFQATNQVGNRGIVFASGDILASTVRQAHTMVLCLCRLPQSTIISRRCRSLWLSIQMKPIWLRIIV